MEFASALLGALMAVIVIGIFPKLVTIFNIWNSKEVKEHHQERSNCSGSSIAEIMRNEDVTAGHLPLMMQTKVAKGHSIPNDNTFPKATSAIIAYPVNGSNNVKHSFEAVESMGVAIGNPILPIVKGKQTNDDGSFNLVRGIGGNGNFKIKGCFENTGPLAVATGNQNLPIPTSAGTGRNDRVSRRNIVCGIGGNGDCIIENCFKNTGSIEVAKGN